MIERLKDIVDFETCKVSIATATPFVVWGSELELALKILTSAGAALYVWRKALKKKQ